MVFLYILFLFLAILAGVLIWIFTHHRSPYSVNDTTGVGTYTLGSTQMLAQIYPSPSGLPDVYKSLAIYQDLGTTIANFTTQSLRLDNIPFTAINVSQSDDNIIVSVQSTSADMSTFAERHIQFVNICQVGWTGAQQCIANAASPPNSAALGNGTCPWVVSGANSYVFFPCFGFPLVNYDIVVFLHFPPVSAMVKGSYHTTATLTRFVRLLQLVDLQPNYPLIDLLPIGAPYNATSFPAALDYFKDYLYQMLSLFLNAPKNQSASRTFPLIVMGAEPIKAWATMIGHDSLAVGDHGMAQLPFTNKQIPWIVGNHPNTTSYQCCPNDPCVKCTFIDKNLAGHETEDLLMLKWLSLMSKNNQLDPDDAWTQTNQWLAQSPDVLCVQARLDYTYSANSGCKTAGDAAHFCAIHDNNPCPDVPITCYGDASGCSA